MIKYSYYTNPRKAYYRGYTTAAIMFGLLGFIIGLTTHGEASTGQYECKSFREILEGFEYDYSPRYEAPPMKPE